ncbi:post-GPI attachment to proteins factor 3-like [Tropilaelaps mercedesae]|uniref:Post-GPI attachment to proteins factor 3-like n=1 Tax=Tropilaelaps mercedesae TaxID=418985 RepID=A0A1V9X9C0_9ACAR|nr:post-GPI attachment to proteins factor 3-like [Tropilaelaps mercedesae]
MGLMRAGPPRSAHPQWGGLRYVGPGSAGAARATLVVTLAVAFKCVESSFGDQSHVFMSCIHNCFFGNCSTDSDLSRRHAKMRVSGASLTLWPEPQKLISTPSGF